MFKIVGDVLNGMAALLPVVSHNLRAAFVIIIGAVMIIGAWHTPAILQSETTRDLLARQLETDQQVGAELSRTLIDTGSDRVVVRQLHNGRHNLAGVPFLFASATHVRTQAGVSWETLDAAPAPLDAYNALLRRMFADPKNPVCATTTTAEVGSAARYHERGVTVSVYCPVVDLRGNPLGVIAAEYVRRTDSPTTPAVMQRLNLAATRVAGYLVPR